MRGCVLSIEPEDRRLKDPSPPDPLSPKRGEGEKELRLPPDPLSPKRGEGEKEKIEISRGCGPVVIAAVTLVVAVAWRATWTLTTPPGPVAVVDFQSQARVAFGPEAIARGVELDRCLWMPTSRISANGTRGWGILQVLGFDPAAIRWVVAGDDGVPGHAGWDDDGNGVVDDERELGVAWSDDHLVVTAAGDRPPGPVKRMGLGGFRVVDGTFTPERWRVEIGPFGE